VNLFGIGPGRKACDDVELSEKAADNLVCVGLGAESIELRHHLGQRALDIGDGAFGVELALFFKATLAFDEFFPVKIRDGMEYGIALRAGIGQEA
jgi:hypothetical protein